MSEQVRRYIIFALGLMFMGFGVACLIKSSLGVSPISSLPYTFALILPVLTVGQWTAGINLLMLFMQIAIKPDVNKLSLVVQFLMTICFGCFIDMSLNFMVDYHPEKISYLLQLATLVFGCFLMAFGTYFDIISQKGVLPMDSFLQLFAQKINKQYTNIRIVSDLIMTAMSITLCLVFLGEIKAVREGTVIAALLCGSMIKFCMLRMKSLTYTLLPENLVALEPEAKSELVNDHNFVLTVSHEYGSGGRTIAKRIAHELDLPYYDTEIIKLAASKGGYTPEYLQRHEEKIGNNALYTLYDLYAASIPQGNVPMAEQIFNLEAQVIREIAANESCVIVGRLANYVLQNHRNALHVFITADEEERVQRVMRKDSIPYEATFAKIRAFANDRKNHCLQFSEKEWGNGVNYDITIKSNRYGVDRTAAILIQLIKEFRLLQF